MTYLDQRRVRRYMDYMPTFEPGELVLAKLWNSLENRAARGKCRPVVVIRREDGHVRALGLTTKPAFRSGTSRIAIPNPTNVGLSKPGYLWGPRLTNIYVGDVTKHLGMADRELLETIMTNVHLNEADREALGEIKLLGTVA